MTLRELRRLLAERGQEVRPGYNYTMFRVRTRSQADSDAVAERLLERRLEVQVEYRRLGGPTLVLLDFALAMPRGVLVPVPYVVALNRLSRAIETVCRPEELGGHLPTWG